MQADTQSGGSTTWFQKIRQLFSRQKSALQTQQDDLNQMKRSNSQMQQDHAVLERSFNELADRESQLQQQLQMVREQVHAGPREVSLLPQAFTTHAACNHLHL